MIVPIIKYNDEFFIISIPVKTLFRSTTVYEVITRGDIFATRVTDGRMTVIPGSADIQLCNCELPAVGAPMQRKAKQQKAPLKQKELF